MGIGDQPKGGGYSRGTGGAGPRMPPDVADRMRGSKAGGRGYAAGGYDIEIPGQGGVPKASFVVALPSVDKPPQASDFNMFGTLAARTSANTPAEIAAFQIPPNTVGSIRSISVLANALLVTSDIIWTLKYNDVAVQGWNELTINPRAAGSVEVSWVPEETFIWVPEGSRISFDVTVRDAGTYQLSVSAHGWFYSSALANIAQSAYPQ